MLNIFSPVNKKCIRLFKNVLSAYFCGKFQALDAKYWGKNHFFKRKLCTIVNNALLDNSDLNYFKEFQLDRTSCC